jgi:hypothetical protein
VELIAIVGGGEFCHRSSPDILSLATTSPAGETRTQCERTLLLIDNSIISELKGAIEEK